MKLPWLPDRIAPSERIIPCPDCGSVQPAFSIAPLGNFVLRSGRAHGVITGHKVCCQACGSVYCVGPSGTYRPHENALPLTPRVRAPSNDRVPEAMMRREPPPVPKEKPRV